MSATFLPIVADVCTQTSKLAAIAMALNNHDNVGSAQKKMTLPLVGVDASHVLQLYANYLVDQDMISSANAHSTDAGTATHSDGLPQTALLSQINVHEAIMIVADAVVRGTSSLDASLDDSVTATVMQFCCRYGLS